MTSARWLSWLFGISVIAVLVMAVRSYAEERELARLLERAHPLWLFVALLLQIATYPAEGGIWWMVVRRAHEAGSLRSYVAMSLAKLFVDQAVPAGGLSGTVLAVQSLDKRGVPRRVSMAALVVDLFGHYAAEALSLLVALSIAHSLGGLNLVIIGVAVAFFAVALGIPGALAWLSRPHVRKVPEWLPRLSFIRAPLEAVTHADSALTRDPALLAAAIVLQLAIVALDAATLWVLLGAIGWQASITGVFASFTLSSIVRILAVFPVGPFEAASVWTLSLAGAPLTAALAGTLLFRGFTFWLPLIPGLLMARRAATS